MVTKIKSLAIFSIIAVLFIFNVANVYGQFEHKVSFYGSIGIPNPVILDGQIEGTSKNSVAINGGLLYNLNRKYALTGGFHYVYMSGPHNFYAHDDGINLGIKYNMLSSKKIIPYALTEACVNYYDTQINEDEIYINWDGSTEIYEDYVQVNDKGISVGATAGLGIDFKLAENFGMFIEQNINIGNLSGYTYFFTEFGVRINMIKSKKI